MIAQVERSFPDALRRILNDALPGHDAFLELSGYRRPDLESALHLDPRPRESAVLALLYLKEDRLHTLLMRRPVYAGVHSGQVSFPGGRREADDRDLWHTALREFGEETGAGLEGIEPLGALSPVYIPPSRSLVIPHVAWRPVLGPVSPDPHEVDQLLEIPMDRLMEPDVLRHREQYIHVLGRSTTIPYFDLAGQVVWGATAMMLAELRQLLLRLRDTQ